MPNPFSRILPNAKIKFRTDALADKPAMAVLVSTIFALWSQIDHELSLLLVKILRADAHPAVAMYSTITSQYMQSIALDAAAKAALSADDYFVFRAAMSVALGVASVRNQLAHWIWGVCEQRPDLLALADPTRFKSNLLNQRRVVLSKFEAPQEEIDAALHGLDLDYVVGYSEADLERAVRDLREAHQIIAAVGHYFDPEFLKVLLQSNRNGGAIQAMSTEQWQAGILKALSAKPIFARALNQAKAAA